MVEVGAYRPRDRRPLGTVVQKVYLDPNRLMALIGRTIKIVAIGGNDQGKYIEFIDKQASN